MLNKLIIDYVQTRKWKLHFFQMSTRTIFNVEVLIQKKRALSRKEHCLSVSRNQLEPGHDLQAQLHERFAVDQALFGLAIKCNGSAFTAFCGTFRNTECETIGFPSIDFTTDRFHILQTGNWLVEHFRGFLAYCKYRKSRRTFNLDHPPPWGSRLNLCTALKNVYFILMTFRL